MSESVFDGFTNPLRLAACPAASHLPRACRSVEDDEGDGEAVREISFGSGEPELIRRTRGSTTYSHKYAEVVPGLVRGAHREAGRVARTADRWES